MNRFSVVLDRIRDAAIETEPFPHFSIENVFPEPLYRELLAAIPHHAFRPAEYPGALASEACGRILPDGGHYPVVGELVQLLQSAEFAALMLAKFGTRGSDNRTCAAIPAEKLQAWENMGRASTTTFEFYKDLPGYEISPHRDTPGKMVTFQFFLVPDLSLADAGGTYFFRPRDPSRPPVPRADRPDWYRWEDFELAKTIRAIPNSFWSFAPSDCSYHGVRFQVPANHPLRERTVARGFIRLGRNMGSYARTLG